MTSNDENKTNPDGTITAKLVRHDMWEKTTTFRWHRLITSYSWSCQWDANYKQTLQQLCRSMTTGETRWIDVEIVEEEAPNCHRYG
jgi:hypothetical protein